MASCLCGTVAFAAEEKEEVKKVTTSGAEIGVWTQDYDAVLKLAKEKNLPIFINFTGSDWCGWCKLMDSKVFSTDEWKSYAAKNLVLAWIDFPRNKDLVPEDFKKRNSKLSEKFGVRGYPTYILLAPDGETQIGQFGASRDATPKDFIKEVNDAAKRPAQIAALSGEKKAAYEKAKAELDKAESALKDWRKAMEEKSRQAQKEFEALNEKIEAAKKAVDAIFE